MKETIIFDGNNIHDIPSFYEEVNRIFLAGVDWKLGHSLDAFNDMLYGGYGRIKGNGEVELIWKNFEQNRKDLGMELTKAYYEEKLKFPEKFNTDFVQEKLAELADGKGQTYFDIIQEIIADHPNIKLIPQ